MLDIVLATLGLVLLAPVLLVVAALLWITSGRPILFRQQRPGLHGRPFALLKFRTMLNDGGATGDARSDAERLTGFGRFLRSTSLDELPELLNVLRGDMSIVGPRPLLLEYLPLYSREEARRHDVLPGITGWAQVHGRNATTWGRRFELDLWYVDHCSVLLDLKIMFRTIGVLLSREGVVQPGHVTMERFQGHGG